MTCQIHAILITIALLGGGCRAKIINGKEVHKYPNGNIQLEYTYSKGVLTGPYKSYYENGQLRSEGEYLNGDLNGVYKTYTPKGQLATEEIYQAGMLSYQKIYWQAIPYEGGFLFVSNTGYEKIKNGQYIDSGNPHS